MSRKMHAIFFVRTGHVLSVLTQTANPDKLIDAGRLAGNEVRFRNDPNSRSFYVPFAETDLGVAVTEFRADAFANPGRFRAEKNSQGDVNVSSVQGQVIVGYQGLTSTNAKITLKLNRQAEDGISTTPFWLRVSSPTQQETRFGDLLFAPSTAVGTDESFDVAISPFPAATEFRITTLVARRIPNLTPGTT